MEKNSQVIVVDASVVIKWFNKEEYTDEAVFLKEQFLQRKARLIAPSLLFYEVINALRYNPNFGTKDLDSTYHSLKDLQIKIVEIENWFIESISIAYKYGITIYDSCYIALGMFLKSSVYTADQKLIDKVQLAILKHIKDVKMDLQATNKKS